ncbi:ABC transporter permease [Streptomyces endophyticus]|uniref:ABC transporter permease n=1 Tax=Streptomyces endophyticus TaxID=714166 RepID=A0ABU6F9P3_9ACTN|nr:ABC transporter permease [Streptomyces endophyticus]MEB8340764.1 ABC transporter permease [Streptomyces endophyticus]
MSTLTPRDGRDPVEGSGPAPAVVRGPAPAGQVIRFVAMRLGGLLLTMFVASVVVFSALHLAPGSVISFLTKGRSVSDEALAELNAQYHLDQPVIVQYVLWLRDAGTGDLGHSIVYNLPVSSILGSRIPATVTLLVMAAVLVLVIGLGLGIVAGLKPNALTRLAMTGATISMAVPVFVAAAVLTLVFAVGLGWFPVFGTGTGFWDTLYHNVLPAVSLALASIAFVGRLSQTAIRTELASDHVNTAISRGLPHRLVMSRHVVRNAAIPMLTVAGLSIAGLLAGSVIVEQVFQLNGLGTLLVNAVQQKDFPVVQAVSLVYVAAFIVLNTLIDVTYTLLDPRVSMNGDRS